jgi:hypothetical protein
MILTLRRRRMNLPISLHLLMGRLIQYSVRRTKAFEAYRASLILTFVNDNNYPDIHSVNHNNIYIVSHKRNNNRAHHSPHIPNYCYNLLRITIILIRIPPISNLYRGHTSYIFIFCNNIPKYHSIL